MSRLTNKKRTLQTPTKATQSPKEKNRCPVHLYYTEKCGTCQERIGVKYEYKRHQQNGKGNQGADLDERGA